MLRNIVNKKVVLLLLWSLFIPRQFEFISERLFASLEFSEKLNVKVKIIYVRLSPLYRDNDMVIISFVSFYWTCTILMAAISFKV